MFVSRCDCCCLCGMFCSNTPYCGASLGFTLAPSGATGGLGNPCNCSSLNLSIADWYNTGLLSPPPDTGNYPAQTHDHSGPVCYWTQNANYQDVDGCDDWDGVGQTWAAGRTWTPIMVYVYYGDDGKWRMVFHGTYESTYLTIDYATLAVLTTTSYSCDIGGEVEFSGSGAPMDCGEVGEMTPTFQLTIPLSRYNEVGTTGYVCNPPTSVVVYGVPA